jgi:hypothetical protein
MKRVNEIVDKIQAKRESISKTKRFLSLNPLSDIYSELRQCIAKRENEIAELKKELDSIPF